MSVPVTILSGTLGAGKTTTLNHVLTADHDYEVAVLVNDMGEVNVDAGRIERRLDDGDIVELSNGCICCGMQGELETAITKLALEAEFDYLLVEPSGISEPAPVARQFARGCAAGFYELSSVATVVDARQFLDAFSDGDVERRGETEDGTRPLSDLLVEGIEFCDTLIINKTDLVTDSELEEAVTMIRRLQPEATLLEAEFGAVDPASILDTERFDPESVAGSAGWKRAIREETANEGEDDGNGNDHHEHGADHGHHGDDDHDHAHPPEVYGVESFLYHRRRPMHSERLAELFECGFDGVLRAKGLLHVAGRPDHAMNLSMAGTQTHVDVSGRWVASLSDVRREAYRDSRDLTWHEEYGDRETQLVFIGEEVDGNSIADALDSCLMTDAELKTEAAEHDNPFPEREGDTLRV